MEEKQRHGSPTFYNLLQRMADIHNAKSHDYASNDNPYGNYEFAGMLSKLFDNPNDAGFIGRIGEKIYRLANLENSGKSPSNETIDDTEVDICTIVALWMASRRDRRAAAKPKNDIFLFKGRQCTWYINMGDYPGLCDDCKLAGFDGGSIDHAISKHNAQYYHAENVLLYPDGRTAKL